MLCGQKKPLPASGIFRLWIRTVSTSFDYQSDWHCAKTGEILHAPKASLITSQIDTAPKPQSHFPHMEAVWLPVRLTLRQNYYFGIAPLDFVWLPVRLTLRQNEQWGDLMVMPVWLPVRLTLRQNAIARAEREKGSLITSQIDTAPKPQRRSLLSRRVWLPVRLTLRQNARAVGISQSFVWLPVRLTLRQNPVIRKPSRKPVWLPVRLTLRQNQVVWHHRGR